tara:strand:+ start:1089 stop:1529 length:441 start_codon:yes stop_codon:yes gene_type:complete
MTTSLPSMTELYNIGMSLFIDTPPPSPYLSTPLLLSPNKNSIEIPNSPSSPPVPIKNSLMYSGVIKQQNEKFTQNSVNRQNLEGKISHPNKENDNIFDKMFDGDIDQSQIQKKRNKAKTEPTSENKEFKLGSIKNSALWRKRNQCI